MKPVYNALEYLEPEKIYSYSNQVNDDITLDVYIQIQSEKFVDYQKEIFEEFVANFVDQVRDVALTSKEIEEMFEGQLQILNSKLQAFADKLRDVPKCELKWYAQLLLDNTVKTWMIGRTTLVIFRDDKMYSILENSYKEQWNIDLFSDFIWGELERWDILLYTWAKLSEVLDQHDFSEIEQVLEKENAWALLDYLDEILSTRVEKKDVGFLSFYSITWIEIKKWGRSKWKISSVIGKYTSKISGKITSKIDKIKWKKQTKRVFNGNRYYIMVWVLVLAVLLLAFSIFRQVKIDKDNQISYQTPSWAIVNLTIDDIRADISYFKTMDPNSDEKSQKYSEILQKISVVEQQQKWQEDIAELKKILNQDYEEWFMIKTISKLSQFDDEKIGRKTRLITFNSSETSKMWAPISISIWSSINIWWEKAAMMGVVNDSTRGNLVEYNLWNEAKDCSLSISKNGLFCYTEWGELFYVNKLWVEPMEVIDWDWASKSIWGLWTYNKSLYLFYSNPNNLGSALLTRYKNVSGSESKYQSPSPYSIMVWSWVTLPQELGGFTIDWDFLAWWGGKVYQFWRDSAVGTTLDMREIEMIGGDKVSSSYSNNVDVIASANSAFVYLFDRDNQTFTVYESSPTKANENYKRNYKLYYLFRFKFDLSESNNRIIAAAVPETSWDKPELYLLSKEWVNKINLYDFIDSLKANKNLKTVNDAE